VRFCVSVWTCIYDQHLIVKIKRKKVILLYFFLKKLRLILLLILKRLCEHRAGDVSIT